MYRDIDLDGTAELLEIRGVGNRLKQIYVFRQSENAFKYMGQLNAHPEFYVARDSTNKVMLLNIHSLGINEAYLQSIEYIDGEFKVFREVPIQ